MTRRLSSSGVEAASVWTSSAGSPNQQKSAERRRRLRETTPTRTSQAVSRAERDRVRSSPSGARPRATRRLQWLTEPVTPVAERSDGAIVRGPLFMGVLIPLSGGSYLKVRYLLFFSRVGRTGSQGDAGRFPHHSRTRHSCRESTGLISLTARQCHEHSAPSPVAPSPPTHSRPDRTSPPNSGSSSCCRRTRQQRTTCRRAPPRRAPPAQSPVAPPPPTHPTPGRTAPRT